MCSSLYTDRMKIGEDAETNEKLVRILKTECDNVTYLLQLRKAMSFEANLA